MPSVGLRSSVHDHELLIKPRPAASGLARKVSPYPHTACPPNTTLTAPSRPGIRGLVASAPNSVAPTITTAGDVGMGALVEWHPADPAMRSNASKTPIIGVNSLLFNRIEL